MVLKGDISKHMIERVGGMCCGRGGLRRPGL